MTDDAAQIGEDRHTLTLRALAGMSLELCRDLQQRALDAENPEDAGRLATAFHRVSRGLRQTLALELKLLRYKDDLVLKEKAAADLAEARAKAEADLHDLAVDQRRDGVWTRVGDCFWSEHEGADWNLPDDGIDKPDRPPPEDPMWDRLEAFLDAEQAKPDFLTRDFDLLVIEACDAIGADPTLIYDIRGRERAEPEPEPATADSS
ncbi:hypothetical protein [Phenylobacterium sp. J367]|uniref:hypothetical protein n=1 Tax=Phenylobacterium sp. J367 TaxID=2898435 RepID=UPI002150D925|nr:hypothetical protein [Phenylobacterium sp. J367]MCR5880512.1 hypothetical protein [Phenylobacterium sp. J367]